MTLNSYKDKKYKVNLVSIKNYSLDDIFGDDVMYDISGTKTDQRWYIDFNGASSINAYNESGSSEVTFPLVSYGVFEKEPETKDEIDSTYTSKFVLDKYNRWWIESFYPSFSMVETMKKCFEYKGYTLENPGTVFGSWGNNHHWIFNFRGKWYIAYHTQTLEKTTGQEKGGYRNIFIDYFEVNADGSLPIQKSTKKGVDQICNFALGEKVPAATLASSRNAAITSKQTVVSVKDGAYLCIKNVEFKGTESEFTAECVPVDGKSIKLNIDGLGSAGSEIAEAKFSKKSSVSAKLKGVSGTHDLYIILPEGVELISWAIK